MVFGSYNSKAQTKKQVFTVVLDAGHGGKDSGNRGNNYYEKHIALKVTLTIGNILEKNPDIKVVYTRKNDVFIPLDKRADIANNAKADLFVSIHCDAHTSQAYGAGTFVLGLHANERNFKIAQKENSVIFLEEDYEKKYDGFDPNNPESVISLVLMQETYLDQSIVAADIIQQSFVKNLKRKNRTVKQAGFLVLRNTYMPSVLVELGFLTNKLEGSYLNSKKGQNDMAQAIAEAIINYKDSQKSKVHSTQNPFEETVPPPEEPEKITFKIQIAASSKSLALIPQNFNGLSLITKEKKGSIYRYFYGQTTSFKKATTLLKEARKKEFKGCFIIAYKGGNRVVITKEMKRN